MSDAQEVLQKMRASKEAEKDKSAKAAVTTAQLTVRLIVMPLRRRQLVVALALMFVVFVSILARDMTVHRDWLLTSLPIIGLGLMICLIPATEEWEYRPWQTRARQYERHQLER